MGWFNIFGLCFLTVIMIPNIVFAIRCKEGFANAFRCKWAEVLEQIGRYGCMATMVFHIPGTWLGWPSWEAFGLYLLTDGVLALLYCLIWVVFRKKHPMAKVLLLSLLPSLLFLVSGILSRSFLLILFSLLFGPAHIFLSCKNAALTKQSA